MTILIEEGGQFVETTFQDGDELVIGLARNQFWFRRRSGHLFGRRIHVSDQRGRYSELPPSRQDSATTFRRWIDRPDGGDPVVLIEMGYPGLLRMSEINWAEVDTPLRPGPGRKLYRAIMVPAVSSRSTSSSRR